MSEKRPPDPFVEPVAPKELAPLLGRSVRWVQDRCAERQITTLPIGKPYRIPADEANRLAGLTGGTDAATDHEENRSPQKGRSQDRQTEGSPSSTVHAPFQQFRAAKVSGSQPG